MNLEKIKKDFGVEYLKDKMIRIFQNHFFRFFSINEAILVSSL